MSVITEPTRYALATLTVANIGIGLILIGLGPGPVSAVFTGVVGWILLAEGALALLWSGRQPDRQLSKARHLDETTTRGKG